MRPIFKRLINAKRPEFIFSLAYFSKQPTPSIAMHKALWLRSCHSTKGILIQILSSCRWYGFWVWRTSYQFSKVVAQEQLDKYGLTRQKLFRELIRYGWFYSLTPSQYMRHQLYKESQKKLVFHFIYDHQLLHFHHHIHQDTPGYLSAVELIADKHRFSMKLRQLGIPTVMSELFLTSSLKKDPSPLFQKKDVFCKPNQGSQGDDAFLLRYDAINNRYSLEPIHGNILYKHDDIDHYLKRIFSCHKKIITQPFVPDHDELKVTFSTNITTTVRIITGRHKPNMPPVVLYLQLEIAKTKKTIGKKKMKQFYTILPLNWKTLDIDTVFQEKYPDLLEEIQPISETLKKLLRDSQKYCIEAHQRMLPLKSVAFDVCLTPAGPVILEANFNWSMTLLYQVIAGDPLTKTHSHPAAEWLRHMFFLRRNMWPAVK